MTLELGLKQGLMGQAEKKQEDWSEAFSVCLVQDEQTEEAMKIIDVKKEKKKEKKRTQEYNKKRRKKAK